MARRRNRNQGNDTSNIFGDIDIESGDMPNEEARDELTTSQLSNIGYGNANNVMDEFAAVGREKITRKPIQSIQPHPAQPRRAIPSAVRHLWSGNPNFDAMAHFFQRWLDEVQLERDGTPFPLDDFLYGEPTPRIAGSNDDDDLDQVGAAYRPRPLEAALLKLVDLAASIRRDGLTNPITLAQRGRDYEIETGERRWLAFHLLHWHLPSDEAPDYARIPAQIVDDISIWRQANENNARADLSAIGKARQLALLLMDLRSREYDDEYAPFSTFDHEQDFYAQVADGNSHRVPRGSAGDLLNAMGLENGVQLRQYRALLRLPQPVWMWADDLDWTESFIRKSILNPAGSSDDMIRLAVRHALREGYTVTSVTEWTHLLDDTPSRTAASSPYNFDHFSNRFAPKIEKQLRRLSTTDRQKAVAHLRELLAQFDTD